MLQLSLNSRSGLPLVDQIVSGVRRLIDDRLLRPGMRLPPIRRFAETHAVSRFTVVESYDRLVALGYLQSRRGAGFFVTARVEASATAVVTAESEHAFDHTGVLYENLDDTNGHIKVGVGWLPPDWLDEEGVLRNIRALARQRDTRVVAYGTPRGFRPLREHLQTRLEEIGIRATPDQIVLTHGATQALDIVARHLLKAGDCVLVDDPGYWNLFASLRLLGVNLIGVPRTPEGPDTAELEALLAEHRPKAFFTHSVLHNPTACDVTAGNAFRILQLADRYDTVIVEDDAYADLHPGAATRLAQLDQLRRVVYIGSFSKTLSANLRVGFLACQPDLAAKLTDIKMISAISSTEFAERLVHRMLIEGHYRKFMERTHRRLADATAGTIRLLERSGMRVYAEPKGGMFIWAEAPGISDSAHLAEDAVRSGIMLAPGNLFRPQPQASSWLRFNVAYALDPLLEPQLERLLGNALERA